MDVDKARHDAYAAAADLLVGRALITAADMDDRTVGERDVGALQVFVALGPVVPGDDPVGVANAGGPCHGAPSLPHAMMRTD